MCNVCFWLDNSVYSFFFFFFLNLRAASSFQIGYANMNQRTVQSRWDKVNAEYRREDVFLSSELAANITWVESDRKSTSWTVSGPLTDSECEPVISHTVLLYPERQADLQHGGAWLASWQLLHVQREALLSKSDARDPVFACCVLTAYSEKEKALTYDTGFRILSLCLVYTTSVMEFSNKMVSRYW